MAQESWKKDSNETECQTPEGPILCANNCGFFGSKMTNNLCSKCYRDFIMKQQQSMATPTLPEVKATSAASASAQFEPVTKGLDKLDATNVVNVGEEQPEGASKKRPTNRCLLCHKRVGLTGFVCRCGSTFCSVHRYPETHECSFDYKSAGREAIAKENPVVKADKIEKI